jgi:hypothetical protein
LRVESLGLLSLAAAGGVGWSDEQAVGHQGVDVGVEIKVFAKRVQRHDGAQNALGAVQGGAEVFPQALVGEGAEPLEQVAVALEAGAQHSRDSQDIMPVSHWGHHLVQDKPGRRLDVLLVTGRAEPAALAGKGQQALMVAMVAANAGETAFEVAALQEFMHHFGDGASQHTAARLVGLGISRLELVVVAVGNLPQRRLLRISGAIGLHLSARQHKDDLCHLTAQVQKHENRHSPPVSPATTHPGADS